MSRTRADRGESRRESRTVILGSRDSFDFLDERERANKEQMKETEANQCRALLATLYWANEINDRRKNK